MTTHSSSAPERLATPHATNSTTNQTISDAVKRRAQSLINDTAIDANGRTWLRYALEINDPALPELVRRADAGEQIFDDSNLLEPAAAISTEVKLECLAEMICDAGDESETRAATLLVLMSTLANSPEPKELANHVKLVALRMVTCRASCIDLR